MTPDPVSWYMIERGWRVVSAEGREIGRVVEVEGDDERDIFDGLEIRMHLLERPRYVPSEAVEAIVEGEIRLRLTHEQAEQLPGR
jgi:hypothetical protein